MILSVFHFNSMSSVCGVMGPHDVRQDGKGAPEKCQSSRDIIFPRTVYGSRLGAMFVTPHMYHRHRSKKKPNFKLIDFGEERAREARVKK